MQANQSQWLAVSVGNTRLAVPREDVAFIAPLTDLKKKAGDSFTAQLHYAGKEFDSYRLDKDLKLRDQNDEKTRFCVCLINQQQHSFVLLVDSLEKFDISSNSLVEPLPTAMASTTNPITYVTELEDQIVLLTATEKLYRHIQLQLPNDPDQALAS